MTSIVRPAGSGSSGGGSANILIREIGDNTIPSNFPVGGLVFTKQPATLREWNGLHLPDATALTTTAVGSGDTRGAL